MKPAPGPWRVSQPQQTPDGMMVHILSGEGVTRWGVAQVGWEDLGDRPIQEANAALIAAAPDLLNNLQYVATCIDAYNLGEMAPDEPVEVVMTAEGARQILSIVAAMETAR